MVKKLMRRPQGFLEPALFCGRAFGMTAVLYRWKMDAQGNDRVRNEEGLLLTGVSAAATNTAASVERTFGTRGTRAALSRMC